MRTNLLIFLPRLHSFFSLTSLIFLNNHTSSSILHLQVHTLQSTVTKLSLPSITLHSAVTTWNHPRSPQSLTFGQQTYRVLPVTQPYYPRHSLVKSSSASPSPHILPHFNTRRPCLVRNSERRKRRPGWMHNYKKTGIFVKQGKRQSLIVPSPR